MSKIIFLIGLPRSGTTLLQRILATHSDIYSVAEPWVLLPLITCFDGELNKSVYGHEVLKDALAGLYIEYPQFVSEYENYVRRFVLDLYGKMSHGNRYFLDKTPRYYLIAQDLHRLFPDGKFIYLFRNPVDIYDSIIETFCRGRIYNFVMFYVDMMHGFNLMSDSIKKYENNIMQVKYEELCREPEFVLQDICGYLDIEYKSSMIENFTAIAFKGRLGDPNKDRFEKIVFRENVRPISMLRRYLYRKLLNSIKEEYWSISGYSKHDILVKLSDRPSCSIVKQIDDLIGFLVLYFKLIVGRKTLLKVLRGRKSLNDIDAFIY